MGFFKTHKVHVRFRMNRTSAKACYVPTPNGLYLSQPFMGLFFPKLLIPWRAFQEVTEEEAFFGLKVRLGVVVTPDGQKVHIGIRDSALPYLKSRKTA